MEYKQYLLFATYDYEAYGGLMDVKQTYNSIEDADKGYKELKKIHDWDDVYLWDRINDIRFQWVHGINQFIKTLKL